MEPTRKLVAPILMIVIGALLLAHNLGVLPFGQLRELIGTWWPVILIALGVAQLAGRG